MKILFVIGTRPNYIKSAPVIHEFKRAGFECIVADSGQHVLPKMSEDFRKLFNIVPDKIFDWAQADYSEIDKIVSLRNYIKEEFPDWVFVFGDVDTALLASLAAHSLSIPIVHVESGLRSRLPKQKEEYNRVIIDRLSEIRYVSEPDGLINLDEERLLKNSYLVGNTHIDGFIQIASNIGSVRFPDRLNKSDVVLLTMHRPENVDDPYKLISTLRVISDYTFGGDVIFPMHPRTANSLGTTAIDIKTVCPNFKVCKPMPYEQLITTMMTSDFVITDSGCIQDECAFIGKHCFTIREATERPCTVECGSNLVIKNVQDLNTSGYHLDQPMRRPLYSDGQASARLVKNFREHVNV